MKLSKFKQTIKDVFALSSKLILVFILYDLMYKIGLLVAVPFHELFIGDLFIENKWYYFPLISDTLMFEIENIIYLLPSIIILSIVGVIIDKYNKNKNIIIYLYGSFVFLISLIDLVMIIILGQHINMYLYDKFINNYLDLIDMSTMHIIYFIGILIIFYGVYKIQKLIFSKIILIISPNKFYKSLGVISILLLLTTIITIKIGFFKAYKDIWVENPQRHLINLFINNELEKELANNIPSALPKTELKKFLSDKDVKEIKASLKPRNIHVIVIESWAHDYYTKSITPYLYSLRKHSIISNKHYTTEPSTKRAYYSIVSGLFKNIDNSNGKNELQLNDIQKKYKIYFNTASKLATSGLFFDIKTFNKYTTKMEECQSISPKDNHHRDERIQLNCLAKSFSKINKPYISFYLSFSPHWPYDDKGKTKKERYINAIKKMDKYLSTYIPALQKKYPHDVFILTGDHGQIFGRHGVWTHGVLYEEVAKVPFILYSKDLKKEYDIKGYTSHINIMPTIKEILLHKKQENSLFVGSKYKNIYIGNEKVAFSKINKEDNTKVTLSLQKNKCDKYNLLTDSLENHSFKCTKEDKKEIYDFIQTKELKRK